VRPSNGALAVAEPLKGRETVGPIALFDKSFLQSLTIDESMWFDHFFYCSICPMFYVETLADLEKSAKHGRRPEEEVRIIAEKFPDLHSAPNVHHATLCEGNLLGHEVAMNAQIVMPIGRAVRGGGELVLSTTSSHRRLKRFLAGRGRSSSRSNACTPKRGATHLPP